MSRRSLVLTLVLAAAGGGGAQAETLAEVLRDAFASSPSLASARAGQAALAESVAQARSAGLPQATLTASALYERQDLGASASGNQVVSAAGGLVSSSGGGSRIETNAGQAQLAVSQPLYTSGRVTWSVRAARARTEAGAQNLRAVQAQVLLDAVTAYADVLQAQEVRRVRRADVDTLTRERDEAQARFTGGLVTKTDVAQAQAQLDAASASVAQSEGALDAARAEFVAAVGRPPGELAASDAVADLPASLDAAFDRAEATAPALSQSLATARASEAAVRLAHADQGPSVVLQGALGYVGPVSPLAPRDYDRDITAQVVLTQPLLTGGLLSSLTRQARDQAQSDRLMVEAVRRQVVRKTAQAWSALVAARGAAAASTAQVRAAELALAGAQAEYAFALRTTLDVLLTDQALRAAQLSLAQNRHDDLVAQAQLLAVIGGLDAPA